MRNVSDFNSATEKYPVVYAGSATRPEFVDMPTVLQQQEGVAPMDTLPAQWWNAMWKLATKDINAFRDFVGDAFTEINNLLTEFGITLDDSDSDQLYNFFHDDYVQNYLSGIFVNKSGDTVDGDLHIKGDLTVDGIGEEIISTELKVGANTITLRNDNPSALGNTELAGVVTENYDGNNHNNIISVDKNGVARTGDIDIATRILYSNDGTNFYTDETLETPATIGATEEVRDTGNQTSGGVEIYEGITYSNNDTQAIATREDNPTDGAFMKWDAATKKLVSASVSAQFDIAWPVGVTYTQYPGQKSPNELWSQYSTWEELDYGGAFFRAEGGNASQFNNNIVVSSASGTTVSFNEIHSLVVGDILYSVTLNESRTVTNVVSNTVVEIDSAFSGSPTLLRFSQKSQNLSHSHTTNTLTNSSGTAITKTGGMDAHSSGSFKVLNYGNSKGKGVVSSVDGTTFKQTSSTDTYSTWGENIACGGSGAYYGCQNTTLTLSHAHDMQHKHGTTTNGGNESRPFNFTVKIWVRTA